MRSVEACVLSLKAAAVLWERPCRGLTPSSWLNKHTHRVCRDHPELYLHVLLTIMSYVMPGAYYSACISICYDGKLFTLSLCLSFSDTKEILMMLSDMDINAIAGTLKLYFRELPEPLLTDRLYPAFMEGTGMTFHL